jgi:hypothetical protein
MLAIDGTQIATVRDSKVRLFATAEHWNAEALGWHVRNRAPTTRVKLARTLQIGPVGS